MVVKFGGEFDGVRSAAANAYGWVTEIV